MARKRLSRLLREAGCEVLAELSDSEALLEWAPRLNEADALFLDIQMPGLTGLEVLAELHNPPPVVFVTAHIHYTIQAFEAAAVDYILKPATESRLAMTLQRLEQRVIPRRSGPELAALQPSQEGRFPVRAGEGFLFLDVRKVSYFDVESEVVYAIANERFKTTWTSLLEVEAALPHEKFIRIHRNLLIRPSMVLGLRPALGGRGKVKMVGGHELDVSRRGMPVLRTFLGLS
jgi:DNA-binding LytR/AlgR family response regulator